MFSILDLLILAPVLGALAIGFRLVPARTGALATAVVVAALTALAAFLFSQGNDLAATRSVLANPEIAYAVGVDGMGMIMLLLSALVLLAAIWVARAPDDRDRLFYICLLLIATGGIGAFASTDLFFFYAFHELALVPTFVMIGLWGRGNRMKTAWRITIYLALGSVVLLVGLIGLVVGLQNGQAEGITFSMAALEQRAAQNAVSPGMQQWIYLLLLIGFGVLISLFPFHSWAPDAYASAPTPTTMLHAGVLKKFGLYGLIRLSPLLPEGAEHWQWLLLLLLLGNILFIGFVTLSQEKLDTMLGYSSVMHMGYVFLGIAAWHNGASIGVTGAVLLMFAHGISIALLFALCGHLRKATGTVDFQRLGGIGRAAPRLTFLFGLAAFASVGLPGFANFAGELLVFLGGFEGWNPSQGLGFLQIATMLAIWGVVISAVYMLRAYRNIFFGPENPGLAGKQCDGDLIDRTPLIVLAVALVVVGFFPSLIQHWLQF